MDIENVDQIDVRIFSAEDIYDVLEDELKRVFVELMFVAKEDRKNLKLKLQNFGECFCREKDGKVYPGVVFSLRSNVTGFGFDDLYVRVTPFNCYFSRNGVERLEDETLTEVHRQKMKNYFDKVWVDAFNLFSSNVRDGKKASLKAKYDAAVSEIDKKYEEDLQSII